MKKRRKLDPDMPIGKLIEVEDFLPPPSQLVFTEPTEKVTIALSKPMYFGSNNPIFSQNYNV